MPRLRRNLHLVTTWCSNDWQCDSQKNTQHDTSKAVRLPRKMTMMVSKVLRLPWKMQRIFWKRRKSIVPATQNDFRHVTKHIWMSPSATPATRNEATRLLKPPKVTPFAELTKGTAIRPSRERLRTVANGCRRLGNVERTHPQPPDPQSETGTLATHSAKTALTWKPLGIYVYLLDIYNYIYIYIYIYTYIYIYIKSLTLDANSETV